LGRKEEQEIGSKRANNRKIRAGRESKSIRGKSKRASEEKNVSRVQIGEAGE
jgi:hypothetical protein